MAAFAHGWRTGLIRHCPKNKSVPSAARIQERNDLKIHRGPSSSATKGRFEAESVLVDEQSCNGDIAPEDIVHSGTVHDFGVCQCTRGWRQSNFVDASPAVEVCSKPCSTGIRRRLTIHTPASEFQEHLWKSHRWLARGDCCCGLYELQVSNLRSEAKIEAVAMIVAQE